MVGSGQGWPRTKGHYRHAGEDAETNNNNEKTVLHFISPIYGFNKKPVHRHCCLGHLEGLWQQQEWVSKLRAQQQEKGLHQCPEKNKGKGPQCSQLSFSGGRNTNRDSSDSLSGLLMNKNLSHGVLKPPEVLIKTKEMSAGEALEYN